MVREHHYSPAELGDFYLDAVDFYGLEYWYNDVVSMHEEMKKASKK